MSSANQNAGVFLALLGSFFSASALLAQKNCQAAPSFDSNTNRRINTLWLMISWVSFLSGYFLDAFAMSFVPVGVVGVLTVTQIIFAALLGHFLLREFLCPKSVFGIMFITLGCCSLVIQLSNHGDDYDKAKLFVWFGLVSLTSTIGLLLICSFHYEVETLSPRLNQILLTLCASVSSCDTLILMNILVQNDNMVLIQCVLVTIIICEVIFQLRLINTAFRLQCDIRASFLTSCFSSMTVILAVVASSIIYDGKSSIDGLNVVAGLFSLFLILFGFPLLYTEPSTNRRSIEGSTKDSTEEA